LLFYKALNNNVLSYIFSSFLSCQFVDLMLIFGVDRKQHPKNLKPLKLFGGNKLPKNWTAEKAVAQMDKVSKHSCSVEEAMRALGLLEKSTN